MLNWIISVTLQYLKSFNRTNEWVMLNRTLRMELEFLEQFNYVQIKLFVFEILETTSLNTNKLLILDRIINVWDQYLKPFICEKTN